MFLKIKVNHLNNDDVLSVFTVREEPSDVDGIYSEKSVVHLGLYIMIVDPKLNLYV